MAAITCVGILVADLIAKTVDKIPEKGRLEFVESTSLHTGGCATNTGIALAKLGLDVGIMGKVGADIFGDFIISELEKYGIKTSDVRRSRINGTSNTIVMVDPDGERRFIHKIGANGDFTLVDVNWDNIKKSKIVHVAGSFLLSGFDGQPTVAFMKKVKELGGKTSLDTCWDAQGRWSDILEPALPYIDYFLPSYEEATMLSGLEEAGEIADFFLDRGVETVGLKMGSKGSMIANSQDRLFFPRLNVEVIDTTGAGDSWVAGFLTGVYKGWPLEKSGKFANAVGASCVEKVGASTGIKTFEETLEMIK